MVGIEDVDRLEVPSLTRARRHVPGLLTIRTRTLSPRILAGLMLQNVLIDALGLLYLGIDVNRYYFPLLFWHYNIKKRAVRGAFGRAEPGLEILCNSQDGELVLLAEVVGGARNLFRVDIEPHFLRVEVRVELHVR